MYGTVQGMNSVVCPQFHICENGGKMIATFNKTFHQKLLHMKFYIGYFTGNLVHMLCQTLVDHDHVILTAVHDCGTLQLNNVV